MTELKLLFEIYENERFEIQTKVDLIKAVSEAINHIHAMNLADDIRDLLVEQLNKEKANRVTIDGSSEINMEKLVHEIDYRIGI